MRAALMYPAVLIVAPFAHSGGTCGVADGYRGMDAREALKVLVRP